MKLICRSLGAGVKGYWEDKSVSHLGKCNIQKQYFPLWFDESLAGNVCVCDLWKAKSKMTRVLGNLLVSNPFPPNSSGNSGWQGKRGKKDKPTDTYLVSQNEADSAWPRVMAFYFFLSQSSDLNYKNKLSLECQVLFKTKILEGGPEGVVSSLRGGAYNEQLSPLQASRRNHHTRIQLKIL